MESIKDFYGKHHENFNLLLTINARLGISPHKANVVKHVRVESYS